jgi:hypothetical protein
MFQICPGALFVLLIVKTGAVAFNIVYPCEKEYHFGPDVHQVILQQYLVPEGGMSIQSCIVKPYMFERSIQFLRQQERPGSIIIIEMAFRGAASNSYDAELAAEISRQRGPAEPELIPGVHNYTVQFRIDGILDCQFCIHRQDDLISFQAELERIVDAKDDLQRQEGY